MNDSTREGLAAARYLAERGVPIFLAPPALDADGTWDYAGGHNGTGYLLPRRWQRTKADPSVIDRWKEGWAVCMVTGLEVDGLDLDLYRGAQLNGRMPRSYGQQVTPSSGEHHLIAPLGVRSRNGVQLGVDVKAGLPDGSGRGFLFLAPTRKVSKTTGAVGQYRWVVKPNLDGLLLGDDDSGADLADLVRSNSRQWQAADYGGPIWEELTERQKARAQAEVDAQLELWRTRLAEAADWADGVRDDAGRGWERLVTDAAWALARLAVAPWAPEFDAEQAYLDLVPDVMAEDPKCRGKWTDGLTDKAAATPADPPPWEVHPEPEDDFTVWTEDETPSLFDATEELRQVMQAARSRRVPPLTLLGQVLARVAVELPPTVQLPALVGSKGTLNIAFGLVGGSGAGKSVSEACCSDLFERQLPEEWRIGLGSGEGLVEAFMDEVSVPHPTQAGKFVKTRVLTADPHRLLIVDEVMHLDAIQQRSGASMAPLLRTALTGGPLKTTTASAATRRNVPAQAYRLAVVAGIQPENAGVLLRDADSGTPQRWVWLPTCDPDAPAQAPEWPGQLRWSPAFLEFGDTGEVVLPEHVAQEVDQNRLHRLRTNEEKLDGQWMVTKIKVAVLLAALHQTLEVTELFWNLAGELMAISDRERDKCLRLYQTKAEREQVGRRRAETNAVAKVTGEQLEKVVKFAVAKLREQPGEWIAWKSFRPRGQAMVGLDRAEVIEELDSQAGVEVDQSEERGQTVVRARYVG